MRKRKVAVFTGNRAEYGLQYPILRAVAADGRLEPYLLAGGSHLDEEFGKTRQEIESDGFQIYREVKIEMPEDTLYATAQAIGTGILGVSRILDELRPDWLVVYADRFESFAALISGTQMGIPSAHIEGGDYTEGGTLDDMVRHAMTKLAHVHFVTNAEAAERVRRMGEEEWRIFTAGYPALDLVAAGEYAKPEEIVEVLELDPTRPVVLFCQHSVATEYEAAAAQVRPSLSALRRLAMTGYQVVITYPNADAGGRRIIAECEKMAAANGGSSVRIYKSLGRHRFYGLLNFVGRVGRGVFAGNSSAIIKETPAFGCPGVHIGLRQRGRLRSANVLDVPYEEDAIYDAIRRCVEDDSFRTQCRMCVNPYGAGNAGVKIADVLATLPIDTTLIRKRLTY